MKNLPILAIVGRPNVGKSALFNRICGKRISIVDEEEGTSRDRIYAETDFFGLHFKIVDTGGIDPSSDTAYNQLVKEQAEYAIKEADSIIMVVDGHAGVTTLDLTIAHILLRTEKPLCLAINKIDREQDESIQHNFHTLGIKNIFPISATQDRNIEELLERALQSFEKVEKQEIAESIKVGIIGRPNVGKSTLMNTLLNEQRCIVSSEPGTTRDSIDIPFTYEGVPYTLIDTAGIRRKKAEKEVVEKFAAIRTQNAIDRADVCLLMLDVEEGITTQDKQIAHMIEEYGKGCALLFNKWDLVKETRMEHCLRYLNESVPFLEHAPKLILSALTGRNVQKIFSLIQKIYQNARRRINTNKLNNVLERAMQKNHPPMITGKRLRIYYMTQVDINPPRFLLFVNYPDLMTESYKRYIINQIRESFDFEGVPLILQLRKRNREEY